MSVLAPLSRFYGLAVRAKNGLYDAGRLQPRRLAWPAISIGNLSVGGAGKTPFTQELARLLQAEGIYVDVLSRGYGRRSAAAVERVPAGSGDARRYGDEPVLLAQDGLPVYVGASRYDAGLLAEQQQASLSSSVDETAPLHLHLLDDGFQHRRLARAVDIVLLRPGDIRGRLLPDGRLREPVTALRRAHFLVLRHDDRETEAVLDQMGLRQPVWWVRRTLQAPPVAGPAVAFAAIAHPSEFFNQLRATGVELRHTFAFRDHHRFTEREMAEIRRASAGCAAILTTEKDAVRMGALAGGFPGGSAQLCTVRLQTELLDAPRCVAALLELLATGRMRE